MLRLPGPERIGNKHMKKCFKCNQRKPLSQFYRHAKMADGHLGKCKECTKVDVRTNRADKIDYYVEYDRGRAMRSDRVAMRQRYAETLQGATAVAAAKERYNKRYKAAYRARTIFRYAIRAGLIAKGSECSSCGKTKRLHGHHDDYSFPLTVRWLCPRCHADWHYAHGPGKNRD